MPANTRFQMFDFNEIVNAGSSQPPWTYAGEGAAQWVSERTVYTSTRTLYLHMKYCKKNPGSNQSEGFRSELESLISIGQPIPSDLRILLEKWKLQIAK